MLAVEECEKQEWLMVKTMLHVALVIDEPIRLGRLQQHPNPSTILDDFREVLLYISRSSDGKLAERIAELR